MFGWSRLPLGGTGLLLLCVTEHSAGRIKRGAIPRGGLSPIQARASASTGLVQTASTLYQTGPIRQGSHWDGHDLALTVEEPTGLVKTV